jgi:hypothetical protein
MPKNLAENMASERPICECGHGPTFHHNPIGYCEHTCACSDYRPAPAATTPERDAMPLSEAIEELRIRANQERYLERRRQRDGQDNTGARVVRAIDTVLAALTPLEKAYVGGGSPGLRSEATANDGPEQTGGAT